MPDAVQPAVGGVEAVGDVGEPECLVVLEQGHEGMGQHFVGAVAHEYLPGLHAKALGQHGLERIRFGIGIQAQAVTGGVADGLERTQRGAVGVLVGVELDQIVELGLFAGDVGDEVVDQGAPVAIHGVLPDDAVR